MPPLLDVALKFDRSGGKIAIPARGENGISYDLTFAELDPVRKNAISHRGHAVWKLVRFLAERQR